MTRLSGSFDSPLSFAETRAQADTLASRSPSAGPSLFDNWAVPEFGEDERIVEYVARIDKKGRLSQYYGATVEGKEATARANADAKEASFKKNDDLTTSDVSTMSSTPTNYGGDWNFIGDDQANTVNHWGELNNNYEWYRIRGSGQEQNAFRTRAASSDDTINPYGRELNVTHDWSVSDLGDEAIHSADPTTSDGGTQTVNLGLSGASLSWEFDSTGHTQNLTNSGPKVDWSNDIPTNGTTWFHPGSHVVADDAHCYGDEDVVDLVAEAVWGYNVYKSKHTWHIYTSTC